MHVLVKKKIETPLKRKSNVPMILIPDDKTQLVRCVEKSWSWRVVRSAPPIASVVFLHRYSVPLKMIGHSNTYGREVLVVCVTEDLE